MQEYCQYQQKIMCVTAPVVKRMSFISKCFNQIMTVFGLQSFSQKTYYGITLEVAQLQSQDQSIEALKLLVDTLSLQRFWRNHTAKWWHLMRLAVSIAQRLQLGANDRHSIPLQQLLKLASRAPQPWQGEDVAYSFAVFSLWSFAQGRTLKAIEQIRIATHAKPSWGYPEYLLGWYGLILEGIDPVPHFIHAIQRDPRLFQQLEQEPLIAHFPKVLQAVKRFR